MSLIQRLQAGYAAFKATGKKKPDEAQPPGRFSFGTQLQGGPRFSDAFQARPSPTLTQLIENYSSLIYAMVACNRDAVANLPLRLSTDGSRAQGGPPGRACDPIRVSRQVGKELAQSGQISSGAVDQVYEIRNHPLLDVIESPDPYGNFTKEQFIGLIVSYMDVVGSAYIVPEGNGWDWRDQTERQKGPPEYLWAVYPQYTIPVRMNASPIVEWFQYFSDRLPRSSVIWYRHNLSLKDAYGSAFSPTNAGESYRRQEQEQVAILSQVLGLGPRPNMIFTAADPLMMPGAKEAEALKIDLARQQGGGYAGGILVNTGAWKAEPISYSPADLAGKEISEYDIYNLAAIFGQPATYYTVNSNLANLQAADEQHAKKGIEPRCKTVAGVFTRLAKSMDPRLSFKFDPALPQDDLMRAQVDKIYFDMGARTANQINQDMKFPAMPWGEEPLLNKNLQTWSQMQEAHEQAMKTADAAMDSMGTKDEVAMGSHELAKDGQAHQQQMDKKQLAMEAKKKEERMMTLAESVLVGIQAELQSYQAR